MYSFQGHEIILYTFYLYAFCFYFSLSASSAFKSDFACVSYCVALVFGVVLVVGDEAAGMAPASAFLKSSPDSNLAPPLTKAE